jgi:hypothetical protein
VPSDAERFPTDRPRFALDNPESQQLQGECWLNYSPSVIRERLRSHVARHYIRCASMARRQSASDIENFRASSLLREVRPARRVSIIETKLQLAPPVDVCFPFPGRTVRNNHHRPRI